MGSLKKIILWGIRWNFTFGCFKIQKNKDCISKCNHKGYFTWSAWIVNKDKKYGLMTHKKKLRTWLHLGGHADGEKNLVKVELKEKEKESGIQSLISLDKEIFDIDIHKFPFRWDSISHTHYDVRFLL